MLAKFIELADAKLDDYLQRLDQSDAAEIKTGGSRVRNLAEKIAAIRGGPGNSDRVISYPRLHERRDAMGKVTRKRYGADFKAKVALDAIKGEQTLAELAAKHGIHQTMIAAWKRQAIEGLASTFSGKAEAVQANSEAELSRLHAKIGQLVVERDFLAKASGR